MRTNRKDWDRDVNDLLGWLMEHLPDGFEIRLSVVNGECSMAIEEDGEPVRICPFDGDHIGHWSFYLNEARKKCGMSPVAFI